MNWHKDSCDFGFKKGKKSKGQRMEASYAQLTSGWVFRTLVAIKICTLSV